MILTSLYYIALSGFVFAFVIYLVGYWATVRHTSRVPIPVSDQQLPPITLIKPIKGCEEELEENLRSFFEQEYPAPVQIVFSSTEQDDPGIAVARRLAQEYPRMDVAFVLSDPSFGLNPKVANMQGALSEARYHTILQTDANVRFRPGFLKRLASEFVAERASLLSCPVGGVGERTASAAIENLHLTTAIGPGMCLALTLANITCVVCKIMLFRRADLEEMGGLSLVKDLLLEDFVLGQTYLRANKKVVLSSAVGENINIRPPLGNFFKRHARWIKMTVIVSKLGVIAYPFSNPLPLVLVAWAASGFRPQLLFLIAAFILFKSLADAYLVKRMRGHAMRFRYWWLSPVRDLLVTAIWAYAAVSRTTEWRGKRFRLGPNTRIFPV